MSGHTIRLRGGWELHDPAGGPARRVSLPLASPLGVAGPVRLSRAFQAPPVDRSRESVWLQLARVPGLVSVEINDAPAIDVRSAGVQLVLPVEPLLRRNLVVLHAQSLATAGGDPMPDGWGEISLVIRSSEA